MPRYRQPGSDKAKTLVRQFQEAAEAKSWAGSSPPADQPAINERYEIAKLRLLDYIDILEIFYDISSPE